MIHKACMPVYINSGKIVADGRMGGRVDIEGSTRGPRGPKKWLPKTQNSGSRTPPYLGQSPKEYYFFPLPF